MWNFLREKSMMTTEKCRRAPAIIRQAIEKAEKE